MALVRNNAAEKAGLLDFPVPAVSRVDSKSDFGKVMQSANAKETNTKDSIKGSVKDSQASVKDASVQKGTEKPVEKMTVKEKLAAVSSKAQDKLAAAEVDPEKAVEAMGALIAGIKELLMETFQVTGEELSDLMADMGISDMDLLSPEMMDQLALRLTDVESPMELLFQPDLMDTLKGLKQEIADMKSETFSELKLTEQEVKGILENMQQENPKAKELLQAPEPRVEDKKAPVETVQDNQPQVEIVKPESTQEAQTEKKDSGSDKGEGTFRQNMQELQEFANPVVTQIAEAVEEVLPESDAQSVVTQLIERIRVSVTEDNSSFEMQLNPEHLGKINLQVAAKNGVVTAQIATENAAVKEALESQIVTLRENLNNQGIKVEAVEVTVASHEFERNLDEQKDGEQSQQGSQKRRFRFDVMQAAEEELTPADALIREMMLANGNQINTTA